MESSNLHGASPAATGGQGVTFAQRVAAIYFKDMLIGRRRAELGDQSPTRIAFQTAPLHSVDDILLASDSTGSSQTLAIACRLTPSFVQSHRPTIDLINSILQELEAFGSDTHQAGIALTSGKTQYNELQKLTEIARAYSDSTSFVDALGTPRRFTKAVRSRFDQILKMVEKTNFIKSINTASSTNSTVNTTWLLLKRLRVIQFNVQSPDNADWLAAASELDPYSTTGHGGLSILESLSSICSEYDARGADVVEWMLRRDLHSILANTNLISVKHPEFIDDLDNFATNAVRYSLGQPKGEDGQLELSFTERRAKLSDAIIRAGTKHSALVVAGKSGTGKSSNVVNVITALRGRDNFEAILLNLRDLPGDILSFESSIGNSFQNVLHGLSASVRVLVIDAADFAVDGTSTLFSYLVSAARRSNVGLVAVTSDNAQTDITATIEQSFPGRTETHEVSLLNDSELGEISNAIPVLNGVLRGLRSDSIFRRLVILDLVSRTGQKMDRTLSEWECLELVWTHLIRNLGAESNASAEARHNTMLGLAAAHIERTASKGKPTKYPSPPVLYPFQLDSAAVDILRRDYILAPWNPRQSWPEFAHDELRRYATALFLNQIDDFPMALDRIGAPRWTLSAASLVCQGLIFESEDESNSTFVKLLNEFKVLGQNIGPRWADVPIEAVLNSPNSHSCILFALQSGSQRGLTTSGNKLSEVYESGPLPLSTLLRVMSQRLKLDNLDDLNQANPAVEYILESQTPWTISNEAFEFLSNWLFGLAHLGIPEGNPNRIRLRERLVEFWDGTSEAENRTPPHATRTKLPRTPELSDSRFIELLALLGSDADDNIARILKQLASDSPECLSPAVDAPTSALSLASYDVNLLADLMEAYYIDDTSDSFGFSLNKGIRPHRGRWHPSIPPFSKPWYGGFSALFSAAPIALSSRVLNRILNHVEVRLRDEATHNVDAPTHVKLEYELDLGLGVVKHSGQERMWSWYRTRSGAPAPCLSALQAMELVVDVLIDRATSAKAGKIIEKLLHNCENLAVPGMIYGILVRHIETLRSHLFPFFAEPLVWETEMSGVILEWAGWGSNAEGLSNPERRKWSPQDVAHCLVLYADVHTQPQLEAIGQKLRENGRLRGLQEHTENWAKFLDARNYKCVKEGGQTYSEIELPMNSSAQQHEITAKLHRQNEYVRIQNAYRLEAPKYNNKYVAPTDTELTNDLKLVRRLSLEDETYSHFAQGAIIDVSRESIHRAARDNTQILNDNFNFAIQSILRVARGFASNDVSENDSRRQAFGVENSAAITLPLLLLDLFKEQLESNLSSITELSTLGHGIMDNADFESQLFLARGCDPIWKKQCPKSYSKNTIKSDIESQSEIGQRFCFHQRAFDWLINSANGAIIGEPDLDNYQELGTPELTQQIESVASSAPWKIDPAGLSIAIRGLGAAAASQHCCTDQANRYLSQLLRSQFRALKSYEESNSEVEESQSVLLIAARSLLQTWSTGRTKSILDLVNILAGCPALITDFLEGVAIAGAESTVLGTAAKAIWPILMDHLLNDSTFSRDLIDNTYGHWMKSALLPQPTLWAHRPYVEVETPLVDWVEATDLNSYVERWIHVSRGNTQCLRALILFLERLKPDEQASKGIGWIGSFCVENGQVLIPELKESNQWIISIESDAVRLGLAEEWQSLVDILVANGNYVLAPHSR